MIEGQDITVAINSLQILNTADKLETSAYDKCSASVRIQETFFAPRRFFPIKSLYLNQQEEKDRRQVWVTKKLIWHETKCQITIPMYT
jgi:hypothetical protein